MMNAGKRQLREVTYLELSGENCVKIDITGRFLFRQRPTAETTHPPPARTRETSTTGRDGPNHRPRYQEGRVNQPEPVRGKSEIENQPNQV
jgi:hypothetical protein